MSDLAEPTPRPERVTVLASGGNTVYLYNAGDVVGINHMEAVLDVAYPAADIVRKTIPCDRWPVVREALIAEGMEIVDLTTKDVEAEQG